MAIALVLNSAIIILYNMNVIVTLKDSCAGCVSSKSLILHIVQYTISLRIQFFLLFYAGISLAFQTELQLICIDLVHVHDPSHYILKCRFFLSMS